MNEGLRRARERAAELRAAGEITVRRTPIERARENPRSLRLAVTAKCFDCVGGDCDPNPRGRIASCPAAKCPLHPVRPYQGKGGQ